VKAAVVQWSHTGIAGSISSVELFLIGDIRWRHLEISWNNY
jgi:hypothetical protein